MPSSQLQYQQRKIRKVISIANKQISYQPIILPRKGNGDLASQIQFNDKEDYKDQLLKKKINILNDDILNFKQSQWKMELLHKNYVTKYIPQTHSQMRETSISLLKTNNLILSVIDEYQRIQFTRMLDFLQRYKNGLQNSTNTKNYMYISQINEIRQLLNLQTTNYLSNLEENILQLEDYHEKLNKNYSQQVQQKYVGKLLESNLLNRTNHSKIKQFFKMFFHINQVLSDMIENVNKNLIQYQSIQKSLKKAYQIQKHTLNTELLAIKMENKQLKQQKQHIYIELLNQRQLLNQEIKKSQQQLDKIKYLQVLNTKLTQQLHNETQLQSFLSQKLQQKQKQTQQLQKQVKKQRISKQQLNNSNIQLNKKINQLTKSKQLLQNHLNSHLQQNEQLKERNAQLTRQNLQLTNKLTQLSRNVEQMMNNIYQLEAKLTSTNNFHLQQKNILINKISNLMNQNSAIINELNISHQQNLQIQETFNKFKQQAQYSLKMMQQNIIAKNQLNNALKQQLGSIQQQLQNADKETSQYIQVIEQLKNGDIIQADTITNLSISNDRLQNQIISLNAHIASLMDSKKLLIEQIDDILIELNNEKNASQAKDAQIYMYQMLMKNRALSLKLIKQQDTVYLPIEKIQLQKPFQITKVINDIIINPIQVIKAQLNYTIKNQIKIDIYPNQPMIQQKRLQIQPMIQQKRLQIIPIQKEKNIIHNSTVITYTIFPKKKKITYISGVVAHQNKQNINISMLYKKIHQTQYQLKTRDGIIGNLKSQISTIKYQMDQLLLRSYDKMLPQIQHRLKIPDKKTIQTNTDPLKIKIIYPQPVQTQIIEQQHDIIYLGGTILKHNFKQSKLWIGYSIQNVDTAYYTKQCIWIENQQYFALSQFFQMVIQLNNLIIKQSPMLLKQQKIFLIHDIYKGKQYWGFRMGCYYNKNIQMSKNGFNLNQKQFKILLNIAQSYIQKN